MNSNAHKERNIYVKIALGVIKPNKDIVGSTAQLIISIALGFAISLPIVLCKDTVSVFKNILSYMNNVFIAFIAMELGAYTLFQALLKKQLVHLLYKQNNLLEKSNSEFLGVILLFWFSIMLNIGLIIIFEVIPDSFVLFQSNNINVIFSEFGLGMYLSFHFRVLFEVRNFAINIYKVFQAHNMVELLEALEEKE